MQLHQNRDQGEHGGVLVATIIATLIVGLVLVGYLTLVGNSNKDGVRSEAWNAAMAVAEAGIEEAMAHLQANYPTNLLAHGWTQSGTNIVKTRTLGDAYFTVSTSLATQPVVRASGFVRHAGGNSYLSRTVQIVTMQTGVVTKAFATKLDIKLNGNNISSDSYDSTDPNLSSRNGQYDPALARDNGDIASNLGTDWAFDAGNADIKGTVSTGPDGIVSFGPNAVVGSTAWHDGGNSGAEDGWVLDDSNVMMPEINMPDMSGAFTPSSGPVAGTNYSYVVGDGSYQIDNFQGAMLVTGHAVVHVTTRLNVTGTEFIRIAPGASLKLYVSAPAARISGGGLINEGGQAIGFQYFGMPSNRQLSIGGNADFTGVVYAPDTAVHFHGNGSVFGAVLSKSAVMNGDFDFHFDEALGRNLELKRIAVLSWEEL